jgi:hypothetical protein
MIVDNADANEWTHDALPKGKALEYSLINSREPGITPVTSRMSRVPGVRKSDSGWMKPDLQSAINLTKHFTFTAQLFVLKSY